MPDIKPGFSSWGTSNRLNQSLLSENREQAKTYLIGREKLCAGSCGTGGGPKSIRPNTVCRLAVPSNNGALQSSLRI